MILQIIIHSILISKKIYNNMKKIDGWFFGFWIQNYKVSFLFFFLIVIVWFLSLYTIPKESSPDIKFGIISIVTTNPWVNPTDMDTLITEKIESEIADIEGISKITSSSSVWVSNVTVELRNDASTRDALTDIKDRIDTLSFPTDTEDPLVQEISTSSDLIFEALLYGDAEKVNNFELIQKAREIQTALEWKNGIQKIELWGRWANPFWTTSDGPEYEVQVLIDRSKLELFGLSLSDISRILRSYNKNTPLWNYQAWEKFYDFRIEGELRSVEELSDIIVRGSQNSLVKLWDIARIEKKYPDETIKSLWFYSDTWYNYITLSVEKKSGSNIFSSSKSAKESLENYLTSRPWFEDLNIVYSQDLANTIKEDYKNLASSATQTLVLVFLTILAFVWLRESLIASFLLPLAFFITFIVLSLLWLSLNFLTNFALVLSLGIAIDTIIVIIEGASERQKLWYSRKNAIALAVYDLKTPLISGTATTLVAFLPMIFLPGVIGKFLAYIPITVFSTLLAALILSLTIASALFYKLAAKKKRYHRLWEWESSLSSEEAAFLEKERVWKEEISSETLNFREKILEKLGEYYYKILFSFLWSKKSRLLSIFIPFILLILSFVFLSPKIGFTLFPKTDNGVITMSITAPVWVDESYLAPYIPQVSKIISSIEELKLYYITISKNTLDVYVELTDVKLRKSLWQRDVFELEKIILESLLPLQSDWLLVEIKTISNGPPAGSPVWVKLVAQNNTDIPKLTQTANIFKQALSEIDGAKNVTTTSPENPWQFVYKFDREKLALAGINPDLIINDLRLQLFWLTSWTLTSRYEDNDIKLLISDFQDTVSPEDIKNIILTTPVWKIRVGEYMSYTFEPALSSIGRENGNILIGVNADVESWYLPTDIQPELLKYAESYNFPEWISYSAWGENEENADLIFATLQSFFIAVFLIFTILVLQFNSYSQPLIILYSVVLALLWVNIWLFLTGNPYSMTFGIGFIALTWVVVNDAIILVDRINRNIERLKRNSDVSKLVFNDYVNSLAQAAQSRLQPIIVTTLTTLFWVLPLALQDAFWAGLGFTIIFGLFAWSFMTLFIIPALYYILYLKKKIRS